MATCIIVGGGLIGMLSARQLAKSGMAVTLLERNSSTGMESSWAGGGILSPLYPWRYPEPVNRLSLWSQAHYRQFAQELMEESGIDPEYFPCGMQVCDADEVENGVRWAQNNGVECQVLAQGRGVLFPQVANIRNPRYAQALRASLVKNKVRIIEQCDVQALMKEGSQVTGVRTSLGEYRADHVVLAGGAWSNLLLETTGASIDIKPVKGQMIVFRAEPGILRHIMLNEGRYLIPRIDGHVLAGSTMEDAGFDKSISEEVLKELKAFAVRAEPALAKFPVVKHWAGLRPGSPEGIPIIAQHPSVGGLYIHTGHFRNGVVLALASAQMLTDLVYGKRSIFSYESYGLNSKA